MPNEPERDIEKLLRTCAQRRRDEAGAPLELHPATRRMLQAEVARRTGKAPPEGNVFVRMLAELRPRLALGVALLAVLLVATWALLPSLLDRTRGKVQMAGRDATLAEQIAQSTAPEVGFAPAEMSAPRLAVKAPVIPSAASRLETQNATLVLSDRMARQNLETPSVRLQDQAFTAGGFERAATAKDEATASFATSEPMPQARPYDRVAFRSGSHGPTGSPAALASEPASGATAPASQAELQVTSERGLFEAGSSRRIDVAVAAPPAAAPPTDLKEQAVYSDRSQTSPSSVTQKFAQAISRSRAALAVRAMKDAPMQEILASFRVTHTGDQVQIIDSDGSIYTGRSQYPPTVDTPLALAAPEQRLDLVKRGATSAKPAQQGVTMSADSSMVPQDPGYSFQVSGTNRTLNQRVVFTGNWTVAPAVPATGQTNVIAGRYDKSQFQGARLTPEELQHSRITGQAVLGDGRMMQIRAVLVSP